MLPGSAPIKWSCETPAHFAHSIRLLPVTESNSLPVSLLLPCRERARSSSCWNCHLCFERLRLPYQFVSLAHNLESWSCILTSLPAWHPPAWDDFSFYSFWKHSFIRRTCHNCCTLHASSLAFGNYAPAAICRRTKISKILCDLSESARFDDVLSCKSVSRWIQRNWSVCG